MLTPNAAQTVMFEVTEPTGKWTNASNSSHPLWQRKMPLARLENTSRAQVIRSEVASAV